MRTQMLSLDAQGFAGCLYTPGGPGAATAAVVVMTGSDGGLDHARYIASRFAARGIVALALAYFKYPGLPRHLSLVPLETVGRAVGWLKRETGLATVALYGASKGAECALVAATLFPDIGCVVAVAPNDYVAEGIGPGKSRTGQSSWSYRGAPLPFAPIPGGPVGLAFASVRQRQLALSRFYEQAEKRGIPPAARIPVERSHARLLLLSGGMDAVWPAQRAGERLEARLCAAGYAYAHRHVCFAQGGHILNPVPARQAKWLRWAFQAERRHPNACRAARAEAFALAVRWIRGAG